MRQVVVSGKQIAKHDAWIYDLRKCGRLGCIYIGGSQVDDQDYYRLDFANEDDFIVFKLMLNENG